MSARSFPSIFTGLLRKLRIHKFAARPFRPIRHSQICIALEHAGTYIYDSTSSAPQPYTYENLGMQYEWAGA